MTAKPKRGRERKRHSSTERELLLGLHQAALQCAVAICIAGNREQAEAVAARLREFTLVNAEANPRLDPRMWAVTVDSYADWISRGADLTELGGPDITVSP